MRTVGIDLAARDENTAMCVVDWDAGRVRVAAPRVDLDDDALLDAIDDADCAGIDAPFGWPQAFADAVAAHQADTGWPGRQEELRRLAADRARYRRTLTYRITDLAVIDDLGVRPLSVSTDRIGVTTFRCALLLDRLTHERGIAIDRSGVDSRVAEVYPAATLKAWDLPHRGYKRATGAPRRRELVEQLSRTLGSGFTEATREACVASDHALDALVAAIVARAVATGRTRAPVGDQGAHARTEGWIHVPTCEPAELTSA